MIRGENLNHESIRSYISDNRSTFIFSAFGIILGSIALILMFVGNAQDNNVLKPLGGFLLFMAIIYMVIMATYYCYCRNEYPDYYDGSICDSCFCGPSSYTNQIVTYE